MYLETITKFDSSDATSRDLALPPSRFVFESIIFSSALCLHDALV